MSLKNSQVMAIRFNEKKAESVRAARQYENCRRDLENLWFQKKNIINNNGDTSEIDVVIDKRKIDRSKAWEILLDSFGWFSEQSFLIDGFIYSLYQSASRIDLRNLKDWGKEFPIKTD